MGSMFGLHHELRKWTWLHVGALGSTQHWPGPTYTPNPNAPLFRVESAPTRAWRPGDTVSRDVPALANLDPNDDTRLPDGSRKVDALALLAVARQVLHA